MYVENGKISNRQLKRLFVFDLMGIATLLLPPYLSKLCGIDGVFAILGGALLSIIYLLYLGRIVKCIQMDLYQYLERGAHPLVKGITLIFLLVHCILTAGFCGYVFSKLMQYSLVSKIPAWVVLFVIMIVAAYAVLGGIESRARVCEVMFYVVLIPFAGMMLAATKNMKTVYFDGFFTTDKMNLGEGIYLVFLFFTPLFFSLFLTEVKEKRKGGAKVKPIFMSICIATGILLGSYLILFGNFGRNSLGSMKYPVVTLMSTIQFKGNFLKRMDALMLAVWFFTLYALLNLHLHYGAAMTRDIFSKNKSGKWQVIAVAILAFGVGFCMQNWGDLVWVFVNYYSHVAVPFFVAWPAVLLLGKKK